MTYYVHNDRPSPGDRTIMKGHGFNASIVWLGKTPTMSDSNIDKLIDILNAIRPTDESAVMLCRMVLGNPAKALRSET